MTLTFSSFSLASLIALWHPLPGWQRLSRPEAMLEFDECRQDRAFLLGMLASHPEAMESEHAMMMLMALYPKHF